MNLLVLVETNERTDAAGGFDVFQLDFVDLTRPGGGLLGLGGVRREAADELLKLGNLRFFLALSAY